VCVFRQSTTLVAALDDLARILGDQGVVPIGGTTGSDTMATTRLRDFVTAIATDRSRIPHPDAQSPESLPMTTIFDFSGLTVLPLWLLMIALPHWSVTQRIMRSPLTIMLPAILYALLVLPQIGIVLPVVLQPELEPLSALLASPSGATIAWVHFLTFDLFVGRWAYLDSRERNISAWLMAPTLFCILMLGPFGFLIYLALRETVRLRRTHQIVESRMLSS
jgi:hypothetical protein